jgi:hypothetical protein
MLGSGGAAPGSRCRCGSRGRAGNGVPSAGRLGVDGGAEELEPALGLEQGVEVEEVVVGEGRVGEAGLGGASRSTARFSTPPESSSWTIRSSAGLRTFS